MIFMVDATTSTDYRILFHGLTYVSEDPSDIQVPEDSRFMFLSVASPEKSDGFSKRHPGVGAMRFVRTFDVTMLHKKKIKNKMKYTCICN